MPNDFFFNTGIATYIWVLDNAKEERRRGKVQLINAYGIYSKMRKSLGSKRNEFSDEQIGRVMSLYRAFDEYTPLRPSADIWPRSASWRRVSRVGCRVFWVSRLVRAR